MPISEQNDGSQFGHCTVIEKTVRRRRSSDVVERMRGCPGDVFSADRLTGSGER